jgi:alkanesulfonate monooxygenase SsuD/methylene tetrahydromethanopterin reductase-like flavin-dependent oxidoreductase (luciferase family)
MQFGVTDHIDASGLPPAEQFEQRLALVELYERLGFSRYLVTEHHGTPLGLAPSPHLFLAAAAQRTSRIGLGTIVSVLPMYHPVRLLEEVGMLDQLSNGRLELGVGRGASPVETAVYGIDPDDRAELFEETFEILIKGLSSDALDHDGRFYSFKDALMVVPTVQQPRPRLWYGVGSVERGAWAAQNSINMMSLLPAPVVRTFTDSFCEAWEATGRPPSERPLRAVNRPLVVAEDEREAQAVADEAHRGFRAALHFLWDRAGVPPPPIFPPTFARWQEIGGAFAGTPEQVREFVAEQVEVAGLDSMNFHFAFGNMAFEHSARTAKLFAEQVMPAFAEVGATGRADR